MHELPDAKSCQYIYPWAPGGELDERAAAAMGRDIERIMREQAAREAARSDSKAVWRALALAGGGVRRLTVDLQPHEPQPAKSAVSNESV